MSDIILSYVNIHYEEPIVFFTFKEGAEIGFPEIREMISYAEKLSGHKPYFTFADVRIASINITTEGKRVVNDTGNMPLFRGTAVLVKNGMYQFAVNFLNQFSKRTYPYKAFTDKKKAVAWLLTLSLEMPAG